MRLSLSNQTLSATDAANAQSTQKLASDNIWSALQSSNYTCSLETQKSLIPGPICLNIDYGPMNDGPRCLAPAANHA